MPKIASKTYIDVDQCVTDTIKRLGHHIVLAAPLGLGKPNQLINAFYRRAQQDPAIQLKIITALSLEKPQISGDLQSRFLNPFVDRVFGDYEDLLYMRDLRANQLPDNITLSEFYFKAGAMKKVAQAQRHYISTNYSFVYRDLIDLGVNVLVQLVAQKTIDGQPKLSLSCNTDVTLDVVPELLKARAAGRDFVSIAQTHDQMPFMYNKAIVDLSYFDMLVQNPQYNTTLFAPPNMAVPVQDYAAGLHASSMIKDGGTLQIGIGSLGDAIAYACLLRHQNNDQYQKMLATLGANSALVNRVGGTGVFDQGLYGSSEMFVNGFMQLIKAGVIKRQVYDDLALQCYLNQHTVSTPDATMLLWLVDNNYINKILDEKDLNYLKHWGIFKQEVELLEGCLELNGLIIENNLSPDHIKDIAVACLGEELKHGIYMHGGFFLGPRDFYQTLRDLPEKENKYIGMVSIGQVNQLSFNYPLYTAQRQRARFINTGMMVTLGGAVVSDGLEDGTVISGVGGQYNFVAMAHELKDARSLLCIRSTRGHGKETQSNIVPHYGHITIPRHLRDIIVTEYGVADLRAKTDEEIIQALLSVSDSRFQDELMAYAKNHGKLSMDYQIPDQYKNNTPEKIQQFVSEFKTAGFFPDFPFGTDFTEEEIALAESLKKIKAAQSNPKQILRSLLYSFKNKVKPEEAERFLARIDLEHPNTAKETLYQNLILLELVESGYLKPL